MIKTLSQLKARYAEITANHRCAVTDDDYARLAERVDVICEMAAVENRSVSLYDINRKEFILKVDRHIELLGYSRDEARLDAVEHYHAMVHPDDLPYLYDSEIRMYDFLSARRDASKKDFKLVYDYRVRAKDGRYIRFLHQMALFELDREFNSWIIMVLSDVLAIFPDDLPPRRYLFDTKTNRVALFNEDSGVKRFIITPAELDVLRLVSQGLDSAAVAERTRISVNTVNNHRQHILEKTGTRNVAQAVMYLRCIGVL